MGLNLGLITTYGVRCGIASYSRDLVNALAKMNVNIYIIRLPRFGLKDSGIFRNIVQSIPIDKIDILHCQHEYGIFSNFEKEFFPNLRRLGKPIVTTLHATGNWELDNVIQNNSDSIIVHNEWCYRRLDYPQKACIIPHGMIPLQTPPPPNEACKKHLGIPPETPTVGYLGFISNYKGLESLIEAMTKVPNAGLLIAGGWFLEQDTPYIVSLKEWTLKVLPNRCQWLGYVPDDELSVVYGSMDIMCYPSRYMTESGAMLTALSHEKAMIASNLPPVREKAKSGALWIFKNTDDLAKKIKRLFKNPDLRLRLQEKAKAFTYENSWENVAKKHIQLYEHLIKSYEKAKM
jgi:glycosyltransferase involved in cell wall biosynthesis